MKKEVIYEIESLYRDHFRVTGYRFGKGEKAVCVVGSIRGNEIQQLYTCSQLVKCFRGLEQEGKIKSGKELLVIPSVNPYSMNVKKRFWSTDNTDINRMFPGYSLGETTQRIAAGVFEVIKDYQYGMQFASFYMPGTFLPHVRMMKTGYEDTELAAKFGLPYVVLRNTRPYDTTTLNYNWQIWETHAFSIYTTTTTEIDRKSAQGAIHGILTFLAREGIVEYEDAAETVSSRVIEDTALVSVRTGCAGIFESDVKVGEAVKKGQVLARVLDPYAGEVRQTLSAPLDGKVFFVRSEPLTYANTAVFKLV